MGRSKTLGQLSLQQRIAILYFVACSLFCSPLLLAEGGANATQNVDVVKAHIAGDLLEHGCDVRYGMSLQCAWVSHQYCIANGYAGGFGPVEYGANIAYVVCIGAAAGTYREYSYAGYCSFANPGSLYCVNRALNSCLAEGYAGSVGVVGANQGVIATVCLTAASGANPSVAAGLGELAQQNPELQTCNYHGIVQGWGCQNHAHRLCVSRGFGTGFNVANYNGSQNTALVCTQAHAVENEFKISEFGDDVRPLAYGTNILGGLAQSALPNGSWLTQGDAIRNDKNVPVVVTQAEVTSSYDGWSFSSDSCFTIGKPTTWQNDPDDEHSGGELMCVYSSEQARPNFNYGRSGRGVVLDPGQTLRFQATPNWGASGNNHYAIAHVTVAPADGYAKMRRMRFPRVDSAYSAGLVQAGCNENCTRVPMSVSEGMNPVSTNKWYVAATHRTIRGITIFTNTAVWGSLRVVQQGGADIRTPYNFQINRDSYSYALGPQAFDESLGAQQTGSAFVPLDIDVPVGALVGIDFYIYEDGGDFAGYVWFE